jgi:putative ABC transport system permease protein
MDIRQAIRALTHSRGSALWVIGSLTIGMAVAIAALALVNALLFRPFPAVTAQERLVRVSVLRDCGRPDCRIRMSSPEDYTSLRDALTGLQGLAAYTLGELAVGIPEARTMRGALASANYFDVLGVHPALGRTFSTLDDDSDAAVAVISHSVWTREFRADPSVLGRHIRVADQFVQIVGVAPPFFSGIDARYRDRGRGPDVWLPLWLADRVLPLNVGERRKRERDLAFVGRLRDGSAVREIQAEAEVAASRLAAVRGQSTTGSAEVLRVWRTRPQNRRFAVIIVMPIPVLVLLIACVNAANMMLARGSQRQREIAIRLAIGAGRRRIVGQLLLESAMLAVLAAALALPIAWWGLQVASAALNVPIGFDMTILALAVATAAITTIAFGVVPAVRAAAQQPSTTLGPVGARSDAVPRQSRARRALVMAQVALSLGLLATASQLVATVRSQAVSSGLPADRLLIASFDLQPFDLPAVETERFYRALLDGAARLAGVESAGLARASSVWTFGRGPASSIRVWHPDDGPNDGRLTMGGYAGGDLIPALGLQAIEGRTFTAADQQGRPKVALVNRTFADRMHQSAVGSVLRVAPRDRDFKASIDVTVVGIIEPPVEPRDTDEDGRPGPRIYLPSPIEAEPSLALYLNSRTPAATLVQPVRELVSQIDPRVPILEIGTLEELNEQTFGPQLWLARAAAFLGIVGLLLATAGLYGVSSFVVAMRMREIAIRMAIGARPQTILAMVLGQSMRMALVGLILGTAAAFAASRVIQSEWHGVVAIDGVAFGGSAALFLAAMLVASAVPAVRASRVDPVENLKDA